jgi:hypothetical protein
MRESEAERERERRTGGVKQEDSDIALSETLTEHAEGKEPERERQKGDKVSE